MIFRVKPVTMSGAPRSKPAPGGVPAASAQGPRFRYLALGRDLAPSATAPSPVIRRAAAPKPAGKPTASAEQERARVRTVAQSEHSIGREAQALRMLGTSASADEITTLLSKMPLDAPAAGNTMLQRLSQQRNPDLGAGDDTDTSRANADEFWSRVRASNEAGR